MWYCIAATVLVVLNAGSVLANLLMLPGNWIMAACLAIFVAALPFDQGPQWPSVAIVCVMALLGEVIETVTGSAKAAKKGASRRAVLLSFGLSILGSIAGTFLVPIPVVGSAIGAVAGAAAGAFGGAWLGEAWIGSDNRKRTEVGTAAMTGRMIGMLAKLSVGVAIFVYQVIMLIQ